jgi:lysophospholipase L1-like esterase
VTDENLVLGLFALLPLICAFGLLRLVRHLRDHKLKPGLSHLLFGNLLLFLLLATGLLLGGEIYYRFIYDTTDSLMYTKVSWLWTQRHWHRNAQGYRDDMDYSPRRQPGKRRVTFLGDSFTAGHGIKDIERRFPNLLRRRHPEWEIHMLAAPGWDTGDELDCVRAGIKDGYQFDEVVLVYCLNDISDMIPEWIAAARKIYAQADQGNWLQRNSYFINTIYARLSRSRNPYMRQYYPFVLRAYQGPLWQKQQARLLTLRDLVESQGGHLAVVTFPFFHALGPNYEYAPVHEQLDQFWQQAKVPHLDLLSIYRDLLPAKLVVNPLDAHPNEYAHALAADAIEKLLKEQLAPRQ